MSFAIVGVGIAAVSAGYEVYQGAHQAHEAKQIRKNQPQYVASPYAQQQYNTARNAYNAPMPGTQQYQQDIASSQGNYLNNINRNATDSGQALALGGLSQGMANNAYSGLQGKEAAYKTDMLGNLNNAYQAMINENDKTYGYKQNEYTQDANLALGGAGVQNTYQGINSLGSDAFVANQYFKNPSSSNKEWDNFFNSF